MNLVRLVARPMLASTFVMDGIDALSNPAPREPVLEEAAETVGAAAALQQQDTEMVVRAVGGAQVAGGLMLALGKLPRLASAVLAATLVPSAIAEHRFWDETDPERRSDQQRHFAKDVSLLGGLLIAAMDTAGRPGLAWRAGHAVEHASTAVERKGREGRLAAKLAKEQGKRRAAETTSRTRREARLARRLAKAEWKRRAADAKRRLTPDVTDLASGVKRLATRD